MQNEKIIPIWEKNLAFLFGTEKVIHLVEGTKDKYLSYDNTGYSTLVEYLSDLLRARGFTDITVFNPVNGFSADPGSDNASENRGTGIHGRERAITSLANKISRELKEKRTIKGFIVEDASFLCVSSTHLSNEEADAWAKIRTAINDSSDDSKVFFIFDNASDIPRALNESSGLAKTIIVSKPDNSQRKQFISLVFPELPDEAVENLSDIAADIPLRKLQDIFQVACDEVGNPGKNELVKYIKQYIYGYTDSPWEGLSKVKVSSLEDALNDQIKGQERATKRISDKVKVAWSGVGSALDGEKAPKGVAVLCGPTGVGKTELAKQLTGFVMGDPNLLIRIDANEYHEEHTAQRLVGSPPGYVGCEQGGQLTNAVNERPFSVILIDEIEKAHPAFWDYFMNILQDGRLTDGRGNLCLFNNTFLLFTTNLGAKEASDNPDEDTDSIIYEAIEKYFSDINRREIFGRLKKHIVPFNFITDEVACQIVEKQMKSFQNNYFASKHVKVNFADTVILAVKNIAGHASEYGGRDIKNTVNECLENQFVKICLDNDIRKGTVINITDAVETGDPDMPLDFMSEIDNSGAEQDDNSDNERNHGREQSISSQPTQSSSRRWSVIPSSSDNGTTNVITFTGRRRRGGTV